MEQTHIIINRLKKQQQIFAVVFICLKRANEYGKILL